MLSSRVDDNFAQQFGTRFHRDVSSAYTGYILSLLFSFYIKSIDICLCDITVNLTQGNIENNVNDPNPFCYAQ